MRIHRLIPTLCLAMSSPGLGCGPDVTPGEGPAADQPLYGGTLFTPAGTVSHLWSGGNVPICWNRTAVSAATATIRNRIQEGIEDSWQRVANIHFTGWGTCLGTHERIALEFKPPGSGGHSDLHDRTNVVTQISLDPEGFWNRALAVHEVGHALGMAHEQERPDNFDVNGNPLFCPKADGAAPFSIPGGKTFGPYDPSSIMNYCAPGKPDKLSALDVIGAANAYLAHPVTCQLLSDRYGISVAAGSWGFAPTHIQTRFRVMRCQTSPNSPDTCQKISDYFGQSPTHAGFQGFLPPEATAYWNDNACDTSPLLSLSDCQRASDDYGLIDGFATVGTAPDPRINEWFPGCGTAPRNPQACQQASDLYGLIGVAASPAAENGVTVVDAGWAPAAVRTWFQDRGCRTQPVLTDRCQLLADRFSIRSGRTWGFAQNLEQAFWISQGCAAVASSFSSCQNASDMFGISSGSTWGFAPQEIQDWFTGNACTTRSATTDACQLASDVYGITSRTRIGFAPPSVVQFYKDQDCATKPMFHGPIAARPVTGDATNDIFSDIALINVGGSRSIPMALSQGDGTFTMANELLAEPSRFTEDTVAKAVPGDFDGDGRLDIALVGVESWSTVPVAFSNGDGTFRVTEVTQFSDFTALSAEDNVTPVPGDFNGDGMTDIALIGANRDEIPVAFSVGDGTFFLSTLPAPDFAQFATAPGARPVSGDFDGDGHADIALTGPTGWATVPVAFSNGDGTFQYTNLDAGDFPIFAAAPGAQAVAGDFDGDGRGDIAITGPLDWLTVPVAFSQGDGTFRVTNGEASSFPALSGHFGGKAVSGDFDGDGRGDIALTNLPGNTFIPIAFSRGDGTFRLSVGAMSAGTIFQDWSALAGVNVVGGY